MDMPEPPPDVEELVRENAELRALFNIQWQRMAEATDRWRAEDPEARALSIPDLGNLLRWLMDDADKARRTHEEPICYSERDVLGLIDVLDEAIPDFDQHAASGDAEVCARTVLDALLKARGWHPGEAAR